MYKIDEVTSHGYGTVTVADERVIIHLYVKENLVWRNWFQFPTVFAATTPQRT